MPSDPHSPESWFDLAERDLQRAVKRFKEADYEDCLFHLQQSAEKVMKGKLVAVGWNLRKTHDLGDLLQDLRERQIDAMWFEPAAEILTSEYITNRYPGFVDQPTDIPTLRGFILDSVKLFESLSGRGYDGPSLSGAQASQEDDARQG